MLEQRRKRCYDHCMRSNNSEQIQGALLTLLGGTCWGLSGSVGQYLFASEGMDSRWLVPVRLGLAGILLLGWCFLNYRKTVLSPVSNRRDFRDLLIYGVAGVSMCQFFYFLTIQTSSAAIATILQSLSPILILAVTCLIDHKEPKPAELVSIGLALLGVFFISTHGSFTQLAIPLPALIFGLLAAVCVTIYNVQPKRLLSLYPVPCLQGWAFLFGSIFFTIVFQPWKYYAPLRPAGLAGIAFVVLVGNVLVFTSYMMGVRRIGPKKAILYGFSEPLTAALVSVFGFHQTLTTADLLGFVLIFLSLVLISLPIHSFHALHPSAKKS